MQLHTKMNFRFHKWHAFVAGFAGGVFVFAIGREVGWAFTKRSAGLVVSEALSAIGSLRWIDTTLITGMAAVAAAFVSVRAVRDQIKQTADIENARRDGKHAANRAALPLALSAISEFAEINASKLIRVQARCVGGALPNNEAIPQFAALSGDVIESMKDIIEFSEPAERGFLSRLIVNIQAFRTRLSSLAPRYENAELILASNISAYLVDAAEIVAMTSATYAFARGAADKLPAFITTDEMQNSLRFVGLDEDDRAEITRLYEISGGGPWQQKRGW